MAAQYSSNFSSFSGIASPETPHTSHPYPYAASPSGDSQSQCPSDPSIDQGIQHDQGTQQAQGPVYYTDSRGSAPSPARSGFGWPAVGLFAGLLLLASVRQPADLSAPVVNALRDGVSSVQRSFSSPAPPPGPRPIGIPSSGVITPHVEQPGSALAQGAEAEREDEGAADEGASSEALPAFNHAPARVGEEAAPAADVTIVQALGIKVVDADGPVEGARVEAVATGSVAEYMGLAPGDLITGLRYGDGRPPRSLTRAQDLSEALPETVTVRDELSLTIRRNGMSLFASKVRPAS